VNKRPHWYCGKNLKIHLNYFDILPTSLQYNKSVSLSSNLTFLGLNIATMAHFTLEVRAKKLGANFEDFGLVIWRQVTNKC
jgi:hypothetical protein